MVKVWTDLGEEAQSGRNRRRTLMEASIERVWVGGVACDLLDLDALLVEIVRAVEEKEQRGLDARGALCVGSINLNDIWYHGVDGSREGFYEDSRAAGREWLNVIDGFPIAQAVEKITGKAWPKISGSDLLPEVLALAGKEGWKVGVFGGSPESAAAFEGVAEEKWGLTVSCWTPGRAEILNEGERLAGEMRAAELDLVIVSLPKPLAEEWMDAWAGELGAGVVLTMGAGMDFQSGRQSRAPEKIQKMKMEWLWRLAKDPRRMWRRYLVEGPGEMWRARRCSGYSQKIATPEMWRARIARRLGVLDLIAAVMATVLAAGVRAVVGGGVLRGYSPSMATVSLAIPVMVVAIGALGGRRARGMRVDGRLMGRFALGVVGGVATLGLISYAGRLDTARGYVALLALFSLLIGGIGRGALAWWLDSTRRSGRNLVRLLAVGEGESMEELLGWMDRRPNWGYRVVGRVASLPGEISSPVGVLAVAGVEARAISEADELMRGMGEVLVVPELGTVDAARLTPVTFADRSALLLAPVDMGRGKRIAKRIVDVVVASGCLLLGALPLAWAAWRIKKEDGGPIIFRQTRVGLDGKEFSVLKLRTMSVDAEALLEDLRERNEVDGWLFKMEDDPRITAIGKKLRKWSLDEVPQFWNVLLGDMSMVGPRPALPDEVALLPEEGHRRHRVRPGLTGLWQVSGRSSLSSQQALALDLHYVANWSLMEDFSIMARTMRAVLARDGAH